MATIAFVAGLLAAVSWGIAPVLSKRGFTYGGRPMDVTSIVVSTGLVMLWAVLLAAQGPALPDLSPTGYAVFLVAGLVGTAMGRIANYTGLDRVGASVNSAVLSTNPLFATVLALVFLGELVSAVQAVGIVVVVVGLGVLTVSKGGDLSGWTSRDLLIPLVGALLYGAGNVVRRYGLTTTAATPLEGAALNETAAFVGIVAYLLVRQGRPFPRLPPKALVYFGAAGIFGAIGVLMLFLGLKYGRVAIVATLAGTATLFTTALSFVFLRDLERVTSGVVAGAGLVVAGVVLITLA